MPTTFEKRKREMKKKEKQLEKAERRAQRKLIKQTGAVQMDADNVMNLPDKSDSPPNEQRTGPEPPKPQA